MDRMTDLNIALLELLHELQSTDINLIICGGFGIYLKTEHVRRLGVRTLFSEWPEPRSTNDLDLFLRPELLIEPAKLEPFAEAIAVLGYQVVPQAAKYQFEKPGPGGDTAGSIKIDILTGPQSCFTGTRVKADDRRARPNPSVGIHAHPMDEVPMFHEGLLQYTLKGNLSTGEYWQTEINIPHPFTFLTMKLFAFKDRLHDANKEFGRYHALDMYTIMATTMEHEWNLALELSERYREDPVIVEARQLVSELFSSMNQLGMIRLQESPYYNPKLQTTDFMSALKELYPSSN
ncbi:MAG: hypothetical protein JXA42_10010 [Anaerolineales bacterium]|nr:hypothetical protein [Anaerolineales bacterium]